MSFTQFSLHDKVQLAIDEVGFKKPTPIQKRAIPPALDGRDVLGVAQTGTGKTAAFVLPLLSRLMESDSEGGGIPRGLIVAPTRELAEQIFIEVQRLSRRTSLRSMTVYGGVGFHSQVMRLRGGVDVIVACPGRLLDHVRQGTIDISSVDTLVLDEADMMFDMGFLDDMQQILKLTAARKQTLLFSATMPEPLRALADKAMQSPVDVQVDAIAPAETVAHALYPVAPHLKTPLLKNMLRSLEYDSMLIFARTRFGARRLWQQLSKVGFTVTCLQGKLSQRLRQAALDGFKRGKYRILVATDIAARGLDVSTVSHVINYDFPPSVDTYIHRIGRTGRASRTGMAMTFVTDDDEPMVRTLERAMEEKLTRCYLEQFNYGAEQRSTGARPAKPHRTPRPLRQSRGRIQGAKHEETQEPMRNKPPRRHSMPSGSQVRIISKAQAAEENVDAGTAVMKPVSHIAAKVPHVPRSVRKQLAAAEKNAAKVSALKSSSAGSLCLIELSEVEKNMD